MNSSPPLLTEPVTQDDTGAPPVRANGLLAALGIGGGLGLVLPGPVMTRLSYQ